MQQVMCLRNCQDKWHVAETGESPWFETWTTLHSNFAQHLQYCTSVGQLSIRDERWNLQHLQNVQTSHCQRMSKTQTWHHDMLQHSTEPTTHQALTPSAPIWLYFKLMSVTDAWVPRPRPGGSDRSRLPSRSRALQTKPDFWNAQTKRHSTETCRIFLIQNLEKQSRNQWFHSASTYSIYDIQLDCEYLTTQLDPRWTIKLQHLQTIQTSHCHRMPGKYGKVTSWHAAAFSDSAEPIPHTRPWPPRHQSGWILNWCPVTDAFIFSASAKAWKQRQIKVGILFVGPSNKTWFLKCKKKRTFNWEMSNLSDSKLEKQSRNPQFHSASTYRVIQLAWEYVTLIRDERWNYSTCKPSKLFTVKGCRGHYIMAILRSPPHTRPWPPRHQSGWIPNWCPWRTHLPQCLGQGLEAATDQRWHLGFTRPADKTWFLTCIDPT